MKDIQTLLDDYIESSCGEASNDDIARYFYELGQKNMRAKMMKEAVDYKIVNNLAAYPVIYYEVNHLGLKYGDKVKIIIVKED